MLKAFLDLFFAIILLLVVSPFLLVVILLILILERDTPFFKQKRIGKGKREFTVYKLRSMQNGKITKFGRVIRATGLDELPQLFNIIKREMSFVGPRPLTESDILRLGWNNTYYKERWSVLPGIVGLAQLAPVCHKKMSWFYDNLYLKKRSVWLDIKILLAATVIPFVGKAIVKKWIHGEK